MIGLLAQSSTTPQSGSGLAFLLPLVLMGGLLYFVMIRPQRRRTAQQQAVLRSLEVGDEVMTSGGIFGTIIEIDDDEDVVTVEIAPGTRIRMVRAGVSRRLTEDEDYDEDDDGDAGEDEDEGADETS